MSNQAEQLAQFLDLTGASEDRARFFLESSGWQLEVIYHKYSDFVHLLHFLSSFHLRHLIMCGDLDEMEFVLYID